MKTLILTVLLATSSLALADSPPAFSNNPRMSVEDRRTMREEMHNFNQDHPMSKEQFEKFKEKALDRHLKHLDMINKSISCIKSASTPDALRGCREKEREYMEQMREQRKEIMEKHREQKFDRSQSGFSQKRESNINPEQRPFR